MNFSDSSSQKRYVEGIRPIKSEQIKFCMGLTPAGQNYNRPFLLNRNKPNQNSIFEVLFRISFIVPNQIGSYYTAEETTKNLLSECARSLGEICSCGKRRGSDPKQRRILTPIAGELRKACGMMRGGRPGREWLKKRPHSHSPPAPALFFQTTVMQFQVTGSCSSVRG